MDDETEAAVARVGLEADEIEGLTEKWPRIMAAFTAAIRDKEAAEALLLTERQAYREKVEALERERDEADRRAGSAERRLAFLEEAGRRETGWLVEAKKSRGYDPGVSFDVVWSETCKLADRAQRTEALLAEAERGVGRQPCEDCGLDWCGASCGRWPKGAVDADR